MHIQKKKKRIQAHTQNRMTNEIQLINYYLILKEKRYTRESKQNANEYVKSRRN